MPTRTATTVLGKRKSRTSTAPAAAKGSSPKVSEEDAQAIFRRHFEAQFAPLAGTKSKSTSKSKPKKSRRDPEYDGEPGEEDDEDEDSDMGESESESDMSHEEEAGAGKEWTGLDSDDDDDDEDDLEASSAVVEVVDHSNPTSGGSTTLAALSKREAKAYLSSKVPTAAPLSAAAAQKPGRKAKATPTDEDSADLLRNDLALQRLLSESHLLNPSKASHALLGNPDAAGDDRTAHTGRNRHKATDLRLAALGSRDSIFAQKRMPMAHRKGIEGARVAREARRRREAKENGIILERPAAPTNKKTGGGGGGGGVSRRAAAVDAPAVGKMHNGMLRLSKRDVAEIEGGGGGRGGPRGGKMKKRRR